MSADRVELIDASEALQRQTAALLVDERRLDDELARFFRKYEEIRGRHAEHRTSWERRFNPPLEAAYAAFRSHGARDHRVELARFAEVPMMELER